MLSIIGTLFGENYGGIINKSTSCMCSKSALTHALYFNHMQEIRAGSVATTAVYIETTLYGSCL